MIGCHKWSVAFILGMVLSPFLLLADIAVPTITNTGIVNGKLNVGFDYTDIPTTDTFELQMKDSDADDSAYATIYSSLVSKMAQPYMSPLLKDRAVVMATNFVGTADFRARFVSGGTPGEWTAPWQLSGYERASGTQIGTTSESVAHTYKANAFDGSFYTMIDDAVHPWVGLDFGSSIRIARIRCLFRPDQTSRPVGAKIQYASEPTFAEPTTAYTVVQADVPTHRMIEVVFAEPISARCVRLASASGGRSSACELEVVPYDVEYYPTLEVVRSDITNFYPTLTWSVPKQLKATTIALERATAETGPWKKLADCTLASVSSYVDEDAKVGVQYYYRGTTDCNNPGVSNDPVSEAVAYRRLRRLDRSWTDETTLLPDITVLPGTNGVVFSTFALAFDGNPLTWADKGDKVGGWGPVGLDFSTNVFVGGFGYICRSNNDQCARRIKTTKLCASTAEDVQRVNKVVCSEFAENYSVDTTLYYQQGTFIPVGGARCWFLYGFGSSIGDFAANVAELMFFGWTEQDIIDAKILSPATGVACRRSDDGLAVVVSWTAGANMTSYRLERRVGGTSDAWTSIATPAVSAVSYTDTSVTQGVWEYRVVAIGADSEESYSTVASTIYYVPGSGTGLKGVLYAPYVAQDALYNAPARKAALPVGPIAFEVASGAEFVAGSGVTDKARILWGGQIVIPMDGTYVFRLETSGGGALHINGQSVCNNWATGDSTFSGEIALTAGTYPIEVDARLETAVSGKHRCVLYWSGAVVEEQVPASQLIPSAAERSLVFDTWDLRQFAGSKLGRAVKTANGFTLTGPSELTDHPNKLNMTALTKPAKKSFDFSTLVTAVTAGRAGVIVRASDGTSLMVGLVSGDDGTASIKVYNIYDDPVYHGVGHIYDYQTQALTSGTKSAYVRLRYHANTTTFTAYWKDASTPEADWTQLWTDSEQTFLTERYEVGYYCSGETVRLQSAFEFAPVRSFVGGMGLVVIYR